MTHDDEPAIEVEVLAIDGAAPPPPRPASATTDEPYHANVESGRTWSHGQKWPGHVRQMHPLWWPLLIIGGGILLVLFLTAGLVLGILVAVFRIVRSLLRALFE